MGKEWKEEYREMLERECFSTGEKDNIMRKLIQSSAGREAAAGNAYMPGKIGGTGRPWTKGIIAACLIGFLVLTGVAGASAAGLLKPASDVFAKVFRLTDNDRRLAEEMGKPLGKSVVSKGIRVTADAVISDSYAYAVVFSIEREDGKPLGNGKTLTPDTWDFEQTRTKLTAQNENVGPAWGEYYSYDETPEDSAIQYVMIAYGDDKIKKEGSISVHLSDLYHCDAEGSKDYTAKGNWNMELSFPESSNEIAAIGEPKPMKLDGTLFTIEDIKFSPISYHLTFSIGAESGLSPADGAKLLESCTMALELKDGKKHTLAKGGSAVKSIDGRIHFVYADTFESLVHMEDIKTIHIGKLKIPMQKK